jgi:hypothetical protein
VNEYREYRRALSRESANRIRKAQKDKGLCIDCDEPVSPGRSRCQTHLDQQKFYRNKARDQKAADGICEKCKAPRLPDKTRCASCLEDQRLFARDRHNRLRDAAFEAYGGYKCNCCGFTYKTCLELDHVNGGGNKHRAEQGDCSTGVYKWLRDNNYPAGMMQVLCANCNKSKHKDGVCKCSLYRHTYNVPEGTTNVEAP